MPSTDPSAVLQADCARCRALCCVGPAFGASADFAVDKPAGQPCAHLGADLRAADLRGADLTGALFLTRGQVQSAVGDTSTRIPDRQARPAHWGSAGEEVEQQ